MPELVEFRMPSLGADMDAAVLVEWKIRPGDPVRRGDIVAVVETAKGAIDVEIFQPGTVDKLVAPLGAKLPVDAVLALIRPPGEPGSSATSDRPAAPAPAPEPERPLDPTPTTAPEPADRVVSDRSAKLKLDPPPTTAPEPAPEPRAAAAEPTASPPAPPPGPRDPSIGPLASPRARRLARELGVDLTPLHGTGPHGAITGDDVQRAHEAAHRPSPQQAMRAAIAAAMTRAKRTIPHYYLAHTVDLSPALAWMAAQNERLPVHERLLPAALLLKAIALSLRDYPELNGHHDGERFCPSSEIHLGVAISLRGGGLIAPALRNADALPLLELMARLRDLTARARTAALRSSEISDPTVTVTSLGDQGVEAVFGVIYPPQVALIGIGAVATRPWVVDGHIHPRELVQLSLAADHRVSDGHRGARFLRAVAQRLQEPDAL